jgi:hypothetical protein
MGYSKAKFAVSFFLVRVLSSLQRYSRVHARSTSWYRFRDDHTVIKVPGTIHAASLGDFITRQLVFKNIMCLFSRLLLAYAVRKSAHQSVAVPAAGQLETMVSSGKAMRECDMRQPHIDTGSCSSRLGCIAQGASHYVGCKCRRNGCSVGDEEKGHET